jgi:Ca-activated chloride channel family protein
MPEWDFHFLRPLWLLFIPYALWLHTRLRRAYSASLQWQGAIEPQLLEHLTVSGRGPGRLRPYQLMTVLLVFNALAVAGPTWEREITPFTQDRAPLVVAIELTPSMLGTDQQPTRLERARQKLRDLLKQRRGARTAVVGYAGSAHLLLPFTDDTELLEIYLEALHPDLMPVPGDAPERALALAESMLANEPVSGSVLFLTDGIDRSAADAFREFAAQTGSQLIFLAFGSDEGGPIEDAGIDLTGQNAVAPPVDRRGLDAVAAAADGRVLSASLHDDDVASIIRRIHTHLVDSIDLDEALAWRDAGYPLVWGVALCMLVWFRRGWTVQWRL